MPTFSCRLPRMQDNAVWQTPAFVIQAGSPPANVDATGWMVVATFVGTLGKIVASVENERLVWLDSARFSLSLSEADCSTLGAGRVDIEITRLSPGPSPKPLARLTVTNYPGLYRP